MVAPARHRTRAGNLLETNDLLGRHPWKHAGSLQVLSVQVPVLIERSNATRQSPLSRQAASGSQQWVTGASGLQRVWFAEYVKSLPIGE